MLKENSQLMLGTYIRHENRDGNSAERRSAGLRLARVELTGSVPVPVPVQFSWHRIVMFG